ncbi:MAG: hypothetical protein ACTHLD_19750, partial [Chitinophaga sp.]
KQTNPWGFWGPIKKEVEAEDPGFVPNKDFKRDMINILTGIVWQMAQVVIPIYFMVRENYQLLGWTLIFIATTWMLKKNWWNRLKDVDEQYKKQQA